MDRRWALGVATCAVTLLMLGACATERRDDIADTAVDESAESDLDGADAALAAGAGDPTADRGIAGLDGSVSVATGRLAAVSIEDGDCLDGVVIGGAERSEIRDLDKVSCLDAHALEVFSTFDIAGADFGEEDPTIYPGVARVVSSADEGCAAALADLVADTNRYGVITLWPSRVSWASGDRTVVSAVFDPSGAPFGAPQFSAP